MNISFKIRNANTSFGQEVYIVGSGVHLGEWNVSLFVDINLSLAKQSHADEYQ